MLFPGVGIVAIAGVASGIACVAPLPLEHHAAFESSPVPLLSSQPHATTWTRVVSRVSRAVPADPSDTVWMIELGVYQGMKVTLRLDAALGQRKKGEHFWRLANGAGRDAGVVGWRSTRYPIPVAFRHGRSADEITSRDSVAFWTILGDMSSDFGKLLFRPATVAKAADPEDVVIIDVTPMGETEGLSRITWSPTGELFDVRITFRGASVLHDPHVVTHEMMHALGFGHTTAWRSVVNPWEASRPQRLTPEDVAYAELAMRSRERHERSDMRRLIALAVERESSRFSGDAGYALCGPELENPFGSEEPMRSRGLLPIALLTVVSGCSAGEAERKGPDTIAVPAAAVDTSTDRVPGATPRAGAQPATGVDTPITRKLGAPAPVKK
jgi:hypothetical protein